MTHDTHDTPQPFPPPLALGAGYYLCAHTMYFYLRGVEIIFSSPRSKNMVILDCWDVRAAGCC